jgi:uncharacterized membrane protein (DUF2068 family)
VDSEPVANLSSARAPTLRLIIAYKFVRAALALGSSAALAVLTWTGHADSLRELAEQLREHTTSHVGNLVAHALVSAVGPRHIWLAVVALALDGGLTLVEGWSLQEGYRWGPWLVVIVVAAFLPFELFGLFRHPRLSRALLLLGNLLVALYLMRHSARESRRLTRGLDERRNRAAGP